MLASAMPLTWLRHGVLWSAGWAAWGASTGVAAVANAGFLATDEVTGSRRCISRLGGALLIRSRGKNVEDIARKTLALH